jgi:hypothetical protein
MPSRKMVYLRSTENHESTRHNPEVGIMGIMPISA